jgi:carboxyl-terminal processing protease
MTEAFVSVVKETHVGTLIGRHTSGAMLGAMTFAVEGGWTLMIPVWDFRTPKGVRVEGVGVGPDLLVKYRQGKDADLAAALKFLKASDPATKRQGALHWWSVFSQTTRAEAGN